MSAVWFISDPDHFKKSFGLKPRTPVKVDTISAEVVRVHEHARSVPEPEDIGQINEPLVPPTPPEPLKHAIIRHQYHTAYDGSLWPEWVCKCGGSGYTPTGVYTSLDSAQTKSRKEGQAHVYNGNKAEDMKAKTNGAFAW